MDETDESNIEGSGVGLLGAQIERLTRATAKTEFEEADFEPRGRYYVIGPDGKAVLTTAQAGWHNEELESPVEMSKFIAQRTGATALLDPAIFYDENRVSLVYDINDRRDRAVCVLVKSEQWLTLQRVAGKAMAQRDFIRMLRVVFRGCVADTGIINNIRNLQWSVNDGGSANLQHGNESLGRSLIQKVQGVDVIPEELRLTIPVFENHAFRTAVDCAIDIDIPAKSFAITPFPQELHNALESTLDDILLQFSQEKFPPAFRGSPSAKDGAGCP